MRTAFFAGPADSIREFVDEQQARVIVAALREGVILSRRAINYLTPTTVGELFLSTPLGWAIRWLSPEYAEQLVSDHKRAALNSIDFTNSLIDRLGGEWFEAAKTGIPASDGTATWQEWKRKALLIADDLQDHVAYQSDASFVMNLPRFVADFVITVVNCATNPTECMDGPGIPDLPIPWWVWAGAAGAALVGGAYVFNTFAPRR